MLGQCPSLALSVTSVKILPPPFAGSGRQGGRGKKCQLCIQIEGAGSSHIQLFARHLDALHSGGVGKRIAIKLYAVAAKAQPAKCQHRGNR